MCGIFCKIHGCQSRGHSIQSHFDTDPKLFNLLQSRGPDTASVKLLHYNGHDYVWNEYDTQIGAGHDVSPQTNDFVIEMSGSTLWMQGPMPTIQPALSSKGALLMNGDIYNQSWNKNHSDTEELLMRLSSTPESSLDAEIYILEVLRSLEGPFAIVYLDKTNKKLYFCRDRLGRHSLLIYKGQYDWIFSSVLGRNYVNAVELPPRNIYALDLGNYTLHRYLWTESSNESFEKQTLESWFVSLKETVKSEEFIYSTTPINEEDSIILERIEKLAENMSPIKFFENVLLEPSIIEKVHLLIQHLSNSINVRIDTQSGYCMKCVKTLVKCENHSTVGILFSGGLDCTVIAALVHKHLPPDQFIDLFNVAFERTVGDNFEVPDRITAKQSFQELNKLFPSRRWNLLEINITLKELREKQMDIIGDLVYPNQTILDESLGSALWFAAQGKTESYASTCRVVLTGMAADELFGGYTRHRRAFKRGGWVGLENELQMDWQRIASRNLARDDRIIGHHGRQPRMPYLDENFVKYVLSLKPWDRCIPSEKCEQGIGDKMLLRLAAFHLGLKSAAFLKKRAIQFGSRIANKKENGNDISQRMKNINLDL